jgi:hypothetical protein
MELTKIQTEGQMIRLVEWSGKRRFARIFKIYDSNPGIDAARLQYLYFDSIWDCFEPTVFSDRLQNKGFQRNSWNATELFMERFIEVMTNAKKHNLI